MATLEKVTIALIAEQAECIREAVEAGEYASTSEAIRDAVREWQERRDLLGYTTEELRSFVQEGLESGPSQYESIDDVRIEGRRRLEIDT
ncbi:ribbon-helix-helix domain-containing protein [Fodinicurvata sediminis]|uniref:ribbon-helix-helix domain-containing protein n=1 Tax=Fodinicurvata sediminis TaxID=1121832 RepID=UPI0003B6BC8F|nr:type II toxin-antitoxin system ParD family antitoxin [Fodinicurvata sediminis]